MSALAQPAAPIPQSAAVALLRTLVLCDLVDSTALVERLGDQRAAALFRKHDRLARALLSTHGGREIDKTDGFLLMFDRPVQAVAFALDYQRALKQLGASEAISLAARVGVHVGDVLAWDNTTGDIANGAKPIEIEGLVKPITSRLMQLALPNQILLSGVAYALAHRAQGELGSQLDKIRWRTHGRYRFKGIPDPIPVFEVGEEGFAPLKAPPWSGKAHREVPFWRRPATLGIELFALFVLLAVPAWYLLKPEPAIAFAQRDWVVVGDLNNLTGETAFDDSIETAFRIGLEQSRYVNVLSDLKTRETIKLMQRDPEATAVDRAIGAEIAIRDGARALILPTIAEIGGRVRVTAEVIDPHTQTTVYSESADGVGEGSVLPSLDAVNQKLRVRLGEALATVTNESKPLEKVATANLDALRAYSLAWRAYDTGHRREAMTLFDQALKLDPNFALARIGLARTYVTVDQPAKAQEQIRKVVEQRSHLSSRDALYVDAWQASFGPQLVALEKWKMLSALYPDFFTASGTLGFFSWQWANRFDEAIEATRKSASPKNPNRAMSDYLLGFLYLGKERYADALNSFASASSPDAISRNEYYASAYGAQRQFSEARKVLNAGHAADVPSEDIGSRITEMALMVDQGEWTAMRSHAKSAAIEASRLGAQKESLFRGLELSLRAVLDPAAEDLPALRDYQYANAAMLKRANDADHANAEFHVLLASYLAARQDDEQLAQAALAMDLSKSRDGRYPVLHQMLKIVEAEAARASGNPDRAVTLLKVLLDGNELNLVHVGLMDAYAEGGHSREALKEARWLAEHRGRAYAEYNVDRMLTPFNVAQSNLAVLRSAELALSLGQQEEARNQLTEFIRAWPRADQVGFMARRIDALSVGLAPAAKTPSLE